MEALAGIFVGIVTFANTLVPQANLPKVLAIDTDTTVTRSGIITKPASLETVRKQFEVRRLNQKQQLQTRLKNVRDVAKKRVTENLTEKMLARHQKWCENAKNTSERLDEMLTKIVERKETAGQTVDIAEANAAIANANTKIDAYCAKTYSIANNPDDKGLGQEVRTAVQALKADTKEATAALKAAKTAIVALLKGGPTNE